MECTFIELEYMRSDGDHTGAGGVIVNISSIAGTVTVTV